MDTLKGTELMGLKPNRSVVVDRLVQIQIECAARDHLCGLFLDPKTRNEIGERAEELRSEANRLIEWLRDNQE